MLNINNLYVKSGNKLIIKNLNLKIKEDQIHVIMGPNGSGKSTLSLSILGHKDYKIIDGNILFMNKNILSLSTYERSLMGIFSTFQNPVEISGISNFIFLKNISDSIRKKRKLKILSLIEFKKKIISYIKELNMDETFLYRNINLSFSGGEKKKNEILQMKIIDPKLIIFDEIDSGLDIDSLKNISNFIKKFIKKRKKMCIIITHSKNFLKYIKPDYIHIIINGEIVKSGNFNLIDKIENYGYKWIKK